MIRILLITWVIFTLTWVLDNVVRCKQTIWYSLHYNSVDLEKRVPCCAESQDMGYGKLKTGRVYAAPESTESR